MGVAPWRKGVGSGWDVQQRRVLSQDQGSLATAAENILGEARAQFWDLTKLVEVMEFQLSYFKS